MMSITQFLMVYKVCPCYSVLAPPSITSFCLENYCDFSDFQVPVSETSLPMKVYSDSAL